MMTLCVAWLREENEDKELIFATDSCLSGGERWNAGVKLFELPRRDCLICFAGETRRAYSLISNLISSIKFDEHLLGSQTDISEVLDYLTDLFTSLCHSITDYGADDNFAVKYIDPDTGTVMDEALPDTISPIDDSVYGDDVGLMNKCYPEGKLKEDLSKRDKHLIKSIVARIAYTQFIDKQQEDAN